jgi:ArsR family transcriptional regulator, nickel/cobalt-responsive transcriptional repressor
MADVRRLYVYAGACKVLRNHMGHGAGGRDRPATRLDAQAAAHVATTLQALATPSRLLILTELRRGPLAVTELAGKIGLEQSAVSHQLRLLRNLGLVVGARTGRSIVYSLYDNHVAQLLDEAIYHSEHLRLGLPDRPTAAGQC